MRVLTKSENKELTNMTNMIPLNRRSSRVVPFEIASVGNMLDGFFNDMWSPTLSVSKDTFKVDVQDNDETYVIEADMPGISKDEISLELRENTLSINVKREEVTEETDKNYVHKERRFESMGRNIYLRDVKNEDIEAKLENGVLTITVPKVSEAQKVKQIDIK